jgi:hypothetical protein
MIANASSLELVESESVDEDARHLLVVAKKV